MCGRYKLTVPFREVVWLYNRTNSVNLPSRYNIAPTQDVLAVIGGPERNQRRGETMRWGLVPYWAKETKIGYNLINAKAETVAEKAAFREAFKKTAVHHRRRWFLRMAEDRREAQTTLSHHHER